MSVYGESSEPEEALSLCFTRCDRPWCEDPSPRPVPLGVDAWICACCSIAGYTAYLPPPFCAPQTKHIEYREAFPEAALIEQPLGECQGNCAAVEGAS